MSKCKWNKGRKLFIVKRGSRTAGCVIYCQAEQLADAENHSILDGDLISKIARDWLVEKGLVVKTGCGWNHLCVTLDTVAKKLKEIAKEAT